MTSYTGRCHCGQVEWTVKLDDTIHVLCHCDACKKLSGAEATLNQVVDQDNVKVTKGELKEYVYKGDSGKPVHCYYCPNCTTHPYHHQETMGPKYVVRTGLLDDAKDFKPAAEVYGKDRLAWMPEVAQTFETMPPAEAEAEGEK
ncbi:MAG: hypothetical protein M1816_004065 [Peltula sp. TS41687]|nr:MAG: hypothetical protein M1816_004065 [Peltula sp. TS41687]